MTTKVKKKTIKAKRNRKLSDKKTYVAIVLDRSGSMSYIHKETVDGLNEQFRVLQETSDEGGDTRVSLIQFDTEIDVLLDGVHTSELREWANEQFVPRGGTAMYDGIWTAINNLKEKVEAKNTAFLVCVISDGAENASKEITETTLANEIKRLQDTGKWTFTYLLANQDINKFSATLNVPTANIASFTATPGGSSTGYAMNNSAVATYMNSTRAMGSTATAAFYNNSDTKLITE